jgi:hypothetical protein
LYTDGVIDYGINPSTGAASATIGKIRPAVDNDIPKLNPPLGFVGFSGTVTNELYQPIGWVWVQPDPTSTIQFESSSDDDNNARYDHTLDFVQDEEYDLKVDPPAPPAEALNVKADTAATGNDVGSLVAGSERYTSISSVSAEDCFKRTYKVIKAPPLGTSYAKDIAESFEISYEQIKKLLSARLREQ